MMARCVFVTDLHGRPRRYRALFQRLEQDPPELVLLGGDLMPHGFHPPAPGGGGDFMHDFLLAGFLRLRDRLGAQYPRVYLILGNDDGRAVERPIRELGERDGLWIYAHDRVIEDPAGLVVIGYSYVPPTPFLLKDWERYDVSRFVDPGCVSPEEGRRTVPVDLRRERFATIAGDLARLTAGVETGSAVLLAHSPPYQTALDHAGLEGKTVDHAPLDPHVGSIAIRRWIENRQPLLALHGHVHESTERTGAWRERIGRTWMFNAATNAPGLCAVEFDSDDLDNASRVIV
ncbi:MAG: hypothetical protein MAG453_00973 [Calditrichaeota bacterium]|nr:hypothetical protein [Calditrichota bacterium]